MKTWNIGEEIEVIDQSYARFPIRGKIVDLDEHPLGDSFAKINVTNCIAADAQEIWVSLRLAKRVSTQLPAQEK